MEGHQREHFEQSVLPHLDAAFNLARWLTQNEHAAEDCAQEAFLRAARYFDSFRGGDARAWLLGIVRRVSYDWLTRNRGRGEESFSEDLHDAGDESQDPAVQSLRRYDQESVRAALDELPPALREVVVLRELEGLSYQQIAEVTEIAIGTVMSRLSRGRQQLQRRLSPRVGK